MPNRPLVAIVDDDESHRRATQSLLRSAGYATVVFGDAESFLSSTNRASTACLVSDMRMPGTSGLELYAALIASGQHIPTVPGDGLRGRAHAPPGTERGRHLLPGQAVRGRRSPGVHRQGARAAGAVKAYTKGVCDYTVRAASNPSA